MQRYPWAPRKTYEVRPVNWRFAAVGSFSEDVHSQVFRILPRIARQKSGRFQYPKLTYEQILDLQMLLYDELFAYAVAHPVRWVK
jgi:hypothetical protein